MAVLTTFLDSRERAGVCRVKEIHTAVDSPTEPVRRARLECVAELKRGLLIAVVDGRHAVECQKTVDIAGAFKTIVRLDLVSPSTRTRTWRATKPWNPRGARRVHWEP